MKPRFPRPNMRRVVVVVPSLFTLFNLFFGLWSMVLATRGEFYRAGWYIVFAAVLDVLDGRFARLSNTGSRFGAELDSLVDVVSFGVAPAFLLYMLAFANAGQAEWIFCYFYVMAATIRLARFNVTQAGTAKRAFIGMPSPAAAVTLATYFPFTQTEFYHRALRELPWHLMLQLLMIILSMLMVSNVRYAAVPRVGMRSARGLLGFVTVLLVLGLGIWRHDIFLFPLGIAYMTYGVVRAAFLGLLSEPDDDEEAEIGGSIVITDGPTAPVPYDDEPQQLSEGGAP
ncbi:MAG TPA: CDP-diacylglycerol--serine O-phosphatidyltransferase [Gemmatimonadales bacterium]|nr:CDP-diacylglycerol--serine O-phosphatidyltransferase [Gemmatimonadales bacterium]